MNPGPFFHSGRTNRRLMIQVLVCLAPAAIAAIWRHGPPACAILAAAIAGAWLAEAVLDRAHATDGSAAVTGAILALVLPAGCPWWIALAGGGLAISVGKHAFGGLGCNPFNPAALSRALLMGLAPAHLFAPRWTVDGVTAASPLAKGSEALPTGFDALLLGSPPGALGQAAPLAVLAGGLLLVGLRTIDWRIPLTYLATVSFLAMVLPASEAMEGHAPWLLGNPLLQLAGGGTLIAAFFMLTDPVAAPFTPGGRIVYAVVSAAAMMAIRYYTPYPDGAALAVLMANAVSPLIDRRATNGSK